MSSNQGASNQQSNLAAAGRNTVIAFVLAAVILAMVIVLAHCRCCPRPLLLLLSPSPSPPPPPLPSAAFFS
jgi:hypothetical protein